MAKNTARKKTTFDQIDPTQCINAKVRRLHKLLDGMYQETLKKYGLKGSMLSMLFLIGKKEGITQTEVAERLVLDQSTVSRDLKKLMEKELISSRQAKDPRSKSMHVTARGYRLLDKIAPEWALLHSEVTNFLGAYQLQTLDQLIHSVKAFGKK